MKEKKIQALIAGLLLVTSLCFSGTALAEVNGAAAGNDYHKVIEHYGKVTRDNPNDAEAYCAMGMAYKELGEYQRAIENYEKAISLRPDYAEAYGQMGIAYGGLGDFSKTIDYCEKAIKLQADCAVAYYGIGVVYSNMGEPDKAIDYLEQALASGRIIRGPITI